MHEVHSGRLRARAQPVSAKVTQSRVTVVVPIYNVASYLPACVDSLVNQTVPVRIILVDDGSTDESGEIADRAARRWPLVEVIHQANRGLSAARNIGLERCEDEFVGFVDADDFVSPRMYERLLTAARSTGSDVVKCGHVRVSEDGRHVLQLRRMVKSIQSSVGRRTILTAYARNRITPVVWDALFRRELFDGVRFPEGRLHEDAYLMPRILARARSVLRLPDALCFHRVRRDSITATLSRGRLDSVRALQELEAMAVEMRLARRTVRSVIQLQLLQAKALLSEAGREADPARWRWWRSSVARVLGLRRLLSLQLVPYPRVDAWMLLLLARCGFVPFWIADRLHHALGTSVRRLASWVHRDPALEETLRSLCSRDLVTAIGCDLDLGEPE